MILSEKLELVNLEGKKILGSTINVIWCSAGANKITTYFLIVKK